jgi:Kef-type K+ transport system membrane component KefB
MRWASRSGQAVLVSTTVVFLIAGGAITQIMGLEAVLGSFVAGILVSRYSPENNTVLPHCG